jgi:hypothetical protein
MRAAESSDDHPTMALVAGTFFGLDITFWHASLLMTSVANATFLVNLGNAAVGFVAWIVLRRTADEDLAACHGRRAARRFLPVAAARRREIPGRWRAMRSQLVAAVMVGLYLFFAKLARRT